MNNIPIIINNFNRLTTTKKMVEDLTKLDYKNIHILDNNSTYEPLLDWYQTQPCEIHFLNENLQSRALYNSRYINQFKNEPWIVYTDSDLELNPYTPKNFINQLILLSEKYNINKVGLAIKINDLPETPYANTYKNWESQFWQVRLEPEVYMGAIDTTFAIIKPTDSFQYEAIRVGGDFTCKHIPWYVNFKDLDDEEQFYLDNSSEDSTYKRFYKSQKTKY